MNRSRWLLLAHQLPAQPSNVRVKVWRRLKALGAVPVKNSIYVLPNRPECREDFEWLRKEIAAMKGSASVFLADSVAGAEDGEIVAAFGKARSEELDALAGKAEALTEALKGTLEGGAPREEAWERLQKQWSELRLESDRLARIDFFETPARRRAAGALERLKILFARSEALRIKEAPQPPPPVAAASLQGRVWVTRASPHIDRLASAWLVRRRVDSRSRFKFVAEPYSPGRGEVRFDMAEGEFTHFGDWCTFETILNRLSLREPVLAELAEIVHDIDLKDGKFGRPEASGVALAVRGLCRVHEADGPRLEAGLALFDSLAAELSARGGWKNRRKKSRRSS